MNQSFINKSNNPKSVPHPDRGAEKLYYLSHKMFLKKKYKLANLLKHMNTFLFRNHIPPSTVIGKRLELAHGGCGVVIHENTIIGDDAIIFQHVTIGNGGARIGHRVYIGAGAVIIGNVHIGNDVVIGANTVVNFSIPDGSTVVGNKGIIIKTKN